MADKAPDSEKVLVDEDDVITSDEAYTHRERNWFTLFLYILIALAFAVIVVFGGRWIYNKIKKDDKPADTTTQQPAVPAPEAPVATTPPAPTPNQTNNSNTGTQTPSTTQIPNSGPGDVLALFIGTAAVVGGLHFVYSLRRA